MLSCDDNANILTFEQKVVFVVLAGHGGPLCGRKKISCERPHTLTPLNARMSFQVFFLLPPDRIMRTTHLVLALGRYPLVYLPETAEDLSSTDWVV